MKILVPTTSDYSLNPQLSYLGNKTRVEFKGSCLKQDKITYTHGKIVKIYIVYEISTNFNIIQHFHSYSTLDNCLFGAVSLAKKADVDRYKYSRYGIGFDRHGFFSHPSGGTGRNVIIFGVDMSSSTKIDNRKKDILILGKGPTQGLEHTLSAEKMYSINFTENNKTFCLSLHYSGANIYLLMVAKDSEIVASLLCLGNNSKDLTVDNIKKTGLNRYIYDFSAAYVIPVDDILDIHKYLMKKNNMI